MAALPLVRFFMNGQRRWIWLGALLLVGGELQGQSSLSFRGQASAWSTVNPDQKLALWFGARYVPQISFHVLLPTDLLLDSELSAAIRGSGGMDPFDSLTTEGEVTPYRVWTRLAGSQWELRLGLQKINFGSSSLLRPLMWFDQVDPRDPLQLSDGVWGLLGRYYFLNNANIWLWGLYGNEGPRTWELSKTASKTLEFGGRVQVPVPRGEAALTFHRRMADLASSGLLVAEYPRTPENRYGLDLKVDVEVGLWLEAAWINTLRDIGTYAHQQILNLGMDYTFGLRNGLHVMWEQLLLSHDQDPFAFGNTTHFSAGSLSYPLNVFDSVSAIIYYDWTNTDTYVCANWQRQLNRLTFHLMAFWNPESLHLPQKSEGVQTFAGKGVQLMVVFNH